MARMRRLQIMIDPELDDWLEREAAARGISKGAIVRQCVRDGAEEKPFDNGLWKLAGIAGDAEPVADIDEYLYGPGGVHA
jgi:Ribbon-helix-helix protein, copG family